MDLVSLLIYVCLGLIGVSLLLMAGFGLRALVSGRKNLVALVGYALAVVLFIGAYLVVSADGYPPQGTNEVTQAEVAIVYTAVIMLGLAFLALIVSGVRGLIR